MNMGCCGRSKTALGLLAEADAFPPSHPRGARARRHIAYSVAAYKAREAGNRVAYDRAMAGLRSLALGDAASDAAAAQSAMGRLFNMTGNRQFTAALSQAQPVINIVLAAAGLGTGIAASVPGADQNAIRIINMVISWIRTLLQGGEPTIPTFDANTLSGFVGFCLWKDTIKGVVDAAFSAAALAAARDAGVSSALNTVKTLVDNLLDGICTIPQIATAVQNAACPANSTWDAAQSACVCNGGYSSGLVAGQCLPVGANGCPTNASRQADGSCSCNPGYSSSISPGQCLPSGTPPVRPFIVFRPSGVTVPVINGGGTSGGTSGGLVKVALPAAALLWYFMR